MSSNSALVTKRERFWMLLAAGSTSSAACEAVGVDQSTGRRWRRATGDRIPGPGPALSGRYCWRSGCGSLICTWLGPA